MNFFDEATLRLKQQLKMMEDKQIAELLGFKPSAWALRKQRDSFPEKELWALSAQRPDLNLDMDYILKGISVVSVSEALKLAREIESKSDLTLSVPARMLLATEIYNKLNKTSLSTLEFLEGTKQLVERHIP